MDRNPASTGAPRRFSDTLLAVARRFTAPSPRAHRAALVIATLAALALGTARTWDRIYVGIDSQSYVGWFETRPPLYPAFVTVFDREPGKPRSVQPTEGPRDDPGHRFLGAVRAQKVLLALAVAAFVLVLSSAVDARLVALMAAAYAVVDVWKIGGDSAVHWNASALMSEGLNQPLVFLFMAATLAYLLKPGWPRAALVAAVLGLLLLNRPANVPLASVVLLVWIFHAERQGARRATARALAVLGIALVPVLAACAWNASRTGYFRLHAFTGANVLCTALQVATPEDLDAFQDDPEARAFLRACVVDAAPKRILDTRAHPEGDYVNVNLHEIAIPAFSHVVRVPPEKEALRAYIADDLFSRVGKRLIARHPVAFAELTLWHLWCAFDGKVHVPAAVAFALGLFLYARSRRIELLYFLFFALLPLLAILPSCAFNYPLLRYRSQLYFAEVLTPLLLVSLVLTHRGVCYRQAPCAESSG